MSGTLVIVPELVATTVGSLTNVVADASPSKLDLGLPPSDPDQEQASPSIEDPLNVAVALAVRQAT